ncbi:MAG: undecaprenyl-diphosphatase UppP [Nanoarchaeota archaeon]
MIKETILLAIIEGLTEFLPISSTGHLILANQFLTFPNHFASTFDLVVQMGAILAVLLYWRKKLIPKNKAELKEIFPLWKKVLVGCLPIFVLGFLFHEILEKYLFNPTAVAGALLVGSFYIWAAEHYVKKNQQKATKTTEQMTYRDALSIGTLQCFSLGPGFSRAAATMGGGIFSGLSRAAATEFSFYLAIPTLTAAGIFKLVTVQLILTQEQIAALLIGTAISFVIAYGTIAFLMKWVQTKSLMPFVWYRILLAVVVLWYS